MLLLNVAATTDRMVFGALAPVLASAMRLDDAGLALVQGPAFGLPYGLALPVAGWLVDRVGARRALAGSVLVWTAGLVVSAAAGSLPLLLAGRAITGVGQAALTPAAFSLIMAVVPATHAGRSLTLFTGAGTIGRGLAFAAGGALLALFQARGPIAPWSATLLTLAGFNLLFLLLGARRLPAGSAGVKRAEGREQGAAILRWLRGSPTTIAAAVIAALAGVVIAQALAAWIAVVLVRGVAVTPARAALLIGAVGIVAGPIGHFAGGMIADARLGRWRRAALPLLCGPAVAGFVAARTPAGALAMLALAMLAAGMTGAIGLVRVQRSIPTPLRGTANGLFMTLVALVGISGGPVLVLILGGKGLGGDGLGGGGIGGGLVLAVSGAALVAAGAGLVADRAGGDAG